MNLGPGFGEQNEDKISQLKNSKESRPKKIWGFLAVLSLALSLNQPASLSQQISVTLDEYQAKVELERFFETYLSEECIVQESENQVTLTCSIKVFSLSKKNGDLVLEVGKKTSLRNTSGLVMIIPKENLQSLHLNFPEGEFFDSL